MKKRGRQDDSGQERRDRESNETRREAKRKLLCKLEQQKKGMREDKQRGYSAETERRERMQ